MSGSSIRAMEKDIESQVDCLSDYKPKRPLSRTAISRAVFCGSGDSYASCLLAEAHSDMEARAADPLELVKSPGIIRRRHPYIVSVSGRTIANIRVAKLAKSPTAITSNLHSRLAAVCGRIIYLSMPNSDIFTAGTVSFMDSALACIGLARGVDVRGASKIYERAVRDAKEARYGPGRIFYLGNRHTYPIAMYAAAKIYEVTGAAAFYEHMEQYSHMELFSFHRGDTVVMFEERDSHTKMFADTVRGIGAKVVWPHIPTQNNHTAQFLYCMFYSQLVPLFQAKKKKLRDCHFITAKKLRAASDRLIY